MTLIEGVGDEVTIFVCVLVVLFVLGLAWISTGVTDGPFVSVIVLDRRTFQHFISRLRGRRVVTNTPTEGAPVSALPDSSQTTEGTPDPEPDIPLVPAGAAAKDNDVDGVGENVCEQAASSLGDPYIAASTPTSEGFVHLGGSQGDGSITSPLCDEQLIQQVVPPSSANELRQRRLAFFSGNSGDADSIQGSDTASAVTPPQPSVQIEEAQAREPPTAPPPMAHAPRAEADNIFTPLDGHIRIRLKYLDDRQRWVQARPEETVGQFKRAHFSAELDENTMIRFIYNGRELSRDGQSLAAYNVSDESVIHCLVSQESNRPHPTNIPPGGVAFDMGSLVFPLFGLILALIWYSRFTYKQYFDTKSTLTLLAISFLFIVALVASLRVQDAPEVAEAD